MFHLKIYYCFVLFIKQGSLCSIKKSAIAEYGVITCDFMDIIRNDNDNTFKYGKAHRSTDQYVLYESDFARANCWTSIWGRYSNYRSCKRH